MATTLTPPQYGYRVVLVTSCSVATYPERRQGDRRRQRAAVAQISKNRIYICSPVASSLVRQFLIPHDKATPTTTRKRVTSLGFLYLRNLFSYVYQRQKLILQYIVADASKDGWGKITQKTSNGSTDKVIYICLPIIYNLFQEENHKNTNINIFKQWPAICSLAYKNIPNCKIFSVI